MNIHILEKAAEDITAIHDWYETKREALVLILNYALKKFLRRRLRPSSPKMRLNLKSVNGFIWILF
jgi:hypothetical protein